MPSLIRWTRTLVVGLTVALAVPAEAAEVDKYLPNDTELVISINVRQILDSPSVKKNLDKSREELKKSKETQETFEALGFDPFKDLDTLAIASAGAAAPDKILLLVHGTFDTAKFKAKAADTAKTKSAILKPIQAGGQTIYELAIPGQPRTLFVGLIDGTTLVASPAQDQVVDALDIKAGKKKSTIQQGLYELLEKADAKQSISIAGLGTALKGLPIAEKITSITGGLNLTDDMRLNIMIGTKDETAAKDLSKSIAAGVEQAKGLLPLLTQEKPELGSLVEIVETLKVTDKGSIVSLKAHVTKEMLEKMDKKEKSK